MSDERRDLVDNDQAVEPDAVESTGSPRSRTGASYIDEQTGERVYHVGPGVYMPMRKFFTIVAIILAVVLLALLIYLLWMMRAGSTRFGMGEPRSGLVAELVVTGPGRGDRPQFDSPMGVAWDPEGRYFYVADTRNNRICVFASSGRFVKQFGGFGIAKPLPGAQATWNPGELNYPTDVAVDEQGRVYVADFYNDSISVFTENGQFLRRFPDPNKIVGKGSTGHDGTGIAVTAVAVRDGKVYATDGYQVFVFTTNGKLVTQFGKPGIGPGDLDHPNGLAIGADGTVYVSDSNHNRVTAFTPSGKVIWVAGGRIDPEEALERNEAQQTLSLVLPRGATLMGGDELLVADPLAQSLVQIDTRSGEVIQSLGERGVMPAEINFPNDVDWHDERILVADRENDRVQIVRLSPQ